MRHLLPSVRPGWKQSLAAMLLGAAAVGIVATTSSELRLLATQLAVAGWVLLVLAIVAGAPRVVGVSSMFVLGAALIEVIANDEPVWIRSIAIGCSWYVCVEMSWDAIERRDGGIRSRSAVARRVRDVATVTLIALLVTLAAASLASLAPVRTLPVQVLVLGGFLLAFVVTARRLLATVPRR